ncbi:GNAT family N-acetyltransferase [Virgibacillus halodenitrificans]|jgi:RimJ/RimL family protein N-acetyltransferase|uniref:N-acetyltransferase n=1 Tax=Virgibacillus halodenitrificans TaxID=1482 RepID=A0AAC9IXU4_VIRHA|nr:GNAT family N-acetyltransferase [Virgibacillus halodenitrificans]APC47254.1 N-acetyltransferase [Virgibacillus halodenitrificans]MBD1224754.1 GNAT family N-acetyltransferase [Virgibacillus halodenitrificans]MCG1028077.1 GNAT family N-acetyltransferase [Virgibacillus halodenitrificans]MCJ0933193.1 GNAT family N-acetyltransferase [Virgibacillus halodenitrificans]MEC2159305.1 GNAT family N-acetyltransferase [Virgibacillus halodenitrificans]
MLKKRDLHEVPVLYQLMSHPDVFPYVRHKAASSDEFYFVTKQTMEAEENGELISRTITDENYHPIGTINLFDIQNNHGFLATWIGQPYFGKGYNKVAKEQFFDELFYVHDIEGIFMKVRKTNKRSLGAVLKLPYAALANATYPHVYNQINKQADVYDLFIITKDHYLAYQQFANSESNLTEEDAM